MRLQNRNVEQPLTPTNERSGAEAEQALMLDRTAALLAAADDAINRALSRDSAEFLAQNRQSGGQ